MSRSELFHVGIVVPDLDVACAHFTDILGLTWGPVIEGDVAVRDAAGNDRVLPNRFAYSSAAPHLELIQETPGTTWVCNAFSNLHHIGFYSDDLTADSADLARSGCPLELVGREGHSAPAMFAYHRDPTNVRVEFVDAASRSVMEQFIFRPRDQ